MADRHDSDREILTSLPRSRPVRRSGKRAARPDAPGFAAAKPKTGAKSAKPRAKAKAAATAKPRAKATAKAAPKAAAARPRKPAARAVNDASAGSARPRRKIPPAGYASPTSRAEDDRATQSADLLGTAVQAAGELAQIGFAVGRQTLKSMLDKLPKL